jgi:hypothetical protein
MSRYTQINYDEFFNMTVMLLHSNLHDEQRQFNWRHPSQKGWLVVTYPRFKYSQYELHLSTHSKHHAKYFGEGSHITSAFYYKTKLNDSDAWIETLLPHVLKIQEQLGKRVVIGPWSDNWVWIAENMDDETITPDKLTALFAQFIQATYLPIALAFNSIGR